MKLGMRGTLLPDAYLKDILLTEVMCNGCFQKISIHNAKEGFWKFPGEGSVSNQKLQRKYKPNLEFQRDWGKGGTNQNSLLGRGNKDFPQQCSETI